MKSYIILSTAAVAAGSVFSSDHSVPNNTENLVAREIDPKSMDPTRLSVLSVLKTAIPCSAHFPEPTGDVEEWYSKLPANIKELLPSLYPVSSTVSASASISNASTSCSSSATVSASIAKLAASDVFTAACSPTSQVTVTTHLTVTKTLHYTLSSTASNNSSRILVALNRTVGALNNTYTVPSPTNGTVRSATPKPSSFTGGAEKVLKVETMAAFAWVGLAAGFVLFA